MRNGDIRDTKDVMLELVLAVEASAAAAVTKTTEEEGMVNGVHVGKLWGGRSYGKTLW